MAAIQFSDFITVCRDGVEYKAFIGDLPFDNGGDNDIDEFVEKRGDTMTGPLLLYAPTPSDALEATSKSYVELQITSLNNLLTSLINEKLPLDFSTLPDLPEN